MSQCPIACTVTSVIEPSVYIHIGCLSDTANKLGLVNRKCKHIRLPQCCTEGRVCSMTRMNANNIVMKTKNCVHEVIEGQIKFGECLLPSSLEAFVFSFAI